ncbi:MAG TPA: trigger factor [Candidatus Saccharimonadales bacterium]|nr:trigger factor [Candidatus Saccharimonadales bacterium]
MQITRTDISPTKINLNIKASADELEPIKKHVLSSHFSNVKVPGFRAGKAPTHLIEKNINQQLFLDEFMEHAINELYRRAVEDQKFRPVGQPEIQLKKFVPYTDLEFETTQEVIGKVTLPNYKTIKLAKNKASVTAKDVDEVIKSLQGRMAERTEVARPAKDGDEVTIDFAGKDESGEPVAGADGKDYPLVLGSKTFIPGFEDNLIGIKTGDSKEFQVTFPADYGAKELQSKKVTFSVTAKKISDLVEPKIDDEFAAKAGPFKTLAELKADVKKQLTSEREWQVEQDYQNELIKKIAAKAKVEVPESLVETELQRMEDEERRNLAYRGQTWQEHLKAEGVTEEEHRDRLKPDAAERVKAGLVLSEISEAEKIDVTAEELADRIQILKSQYQDPTMQAELDKPESRQDIANRLLTEKTILKLVDYATS